MPTNRDSDRNYWLLKTEPTTFSFDDLWKAPKRTTSWDGVRNFQARNLLRDGMKEGDLVFIYHSSTDPTGIVGIAEVAKAGYPDPTAFDPKDSHFDPKSRKDSPTWYVVVDSSSKTDAAKRGVNFAPRLRNARVARPVTPSPKSTQLEGSGTGESWKFPTVKSAVVRLTL